MTGDDGWLHAASCMPSRLTLLCKAEEGTAEGRRQAAEGVCCARRRKADGRRRLTSSCPAPLLPPALQVLRVHPIKGDGRCLFRAIAQSLAHVESRPLTEQYQTKDADALRKAAMYVICNEKRDAFEQAKVIEGDMTTYCRNMNSPNFYGGEPELFVLAEELRRPIAVYVPQGDGFKAIVEYGAKYARERSRIRILYNGQNHYDALLD